MKKSMIVFIALMLFTAAAPDLFCSDLEKAQGHFSRGVLQYDEKHYEQALGDFLEAEKFQTSAYLFFNTGNCYLKLGQKGYAVLYYEKAKRLLPHDPDIEHNLKHVRGLLKDRITSTPLRLSAKIIQSLDQFFSARLLALFSLGIFLLCIFLSVFLSLTQKRLRFVFFAFFLALVLITGLVSQKVLKQKKVMHGIIISKKAQVRFGPGETVAFEIHEGAKVKIVRERQNWYLIRLEDGKSGYVARDAVERI